MVEIKRLDDRYTLSAQMAAEDFDAAKQLGANLIIGNRVEGEEPGQPTGLAMMSEAAHRDMEWLTLPMGGTQFPIAEIGELAKLLKNDSITIHAFCKSGMRSAALWAFATALNKSMTPDEIVEKIRSIGFDTSSFEDAITLLYNSGNDSLQ